MSLIQNHHIHSTMTYRGYAARIEYSDDDRCFVGHIAGINDVVGFHAESVNELRAAFEEAVDDYLATCERLGKPPQKPYSGKLMLRIPPEVHAHAAMMAQAQGKSLNQWAAEVLSKAS
jgi:predicted HicB family RNase H-like nuclease